MVALLLIFCYGISGSHYNFSTIVDLQAIADSTAFRTGLDQLVDYKYLPLLGRSIAVIANVGSKSVANRLIFDIFQQDIPAQCQAFIQVNKRLLKRTETNFIYANSDSSTSVKYFQLSERDYQINEQMLNQAELIVVDLPNNGLRESLELGVLVEVLKFSAEHQIPVMVLDRPNPLRALETGGPISSRSMFLNGYRLPARYGMTIGELALLFNEENWLKTGHRVPLTIVKMANYHHNMSWQETGLQWYYPEDFVLDEETAILFSGLYFLQFTNISLGYGTIQPYQFIGAPWISGVDLLKVLTEKKMAGIDLYPVKFRPTPIGSTKELPLYFSIECSGVSVRISDPASFEPYKFGVTLLSAISGLYPYQFKWTAGQEADQYFGSPDFRTWVDIGADLQPMLPTWLADVTEFQKSRLRYNLYPD